MSDAIRRTCSSCHRAKTACDGERPCGRCLRLNRQTDCHPHVRKPRSLRTVDTTPVVHVATLADSAPRAAHLAAGLRDLDGSLLAVDALGASLMNAGGVALAEMSFTGMSPVATSSRSTISISVGPDALAPVSLISSGLTPANDDLAYHLDPFGLTTYSDLSRSPTIPGDDRGNQPAVHHSDGVRDTSWCSGSPLTLDITGSSMQWRGPPDPIHSAAASAVPGTPLRAASFTRANGMQITQVFSGESAGTQVTTRRTSTLSFTESFEPVATTKRVADVNFQRLAEMNYRSVAKDSIVNGNLSPSSLVWVMSALSERMEFGDWKRFAPLVPLPPVCSVRAPFASGAPFEEWIRNRKRVTTDSSEEVVNALMTDASSRTPGRSTASDIATASPSSSLPVIPIPTLYEEVWTSSPLHCVEDEQMLAGLLTPALMQQRSLDVPVAVMTIRCRKMPAASSPHSASSSRLDERSNIRRRSPRSVSPERARDSTTSRSRSVSPPVATRARDYGSSEDAHNTFSPSSPRHTRKIGRNDHPADRYHESARGRSPQTLSRIDQQDKLAAELQRRLDTFTHGEKPSEFDILRTKHAQNCARHRSGVEDRPLPNPPGCHMVSEATWSALHDECGCPMFARREMFVQVNRQFERLFGYSQADIRNMFIRQGEPRASAVMSDLQDDDTWEFTNLAVMLSLTRSAEFRTVANIRSRWNRTLRVQLAVNVTVVDGEVDSTVCSYMPW